MNISSTRSYDPYSPQGMTIDRLVSADFMTGAQKNNPQLLTGKAIPDFSGYKLEPTTDVLSLSESGASQAKMQTLKISGEMKMIEPKYNLRGADFSYDELQASRKFMEGLSQSMRENGALLGALDYDDYATMGLGESQLRAFSAEQGLNKAQTEALLTDYRASIKELVEENLSKYPFDRQVTHLPHSPYFFTYQHEGLTIDDRVIVKEDALATGVDVAVNWDMIRSVYDTMAQVDANDAGSFEKAIDAFMEKAFEARSAGSLSSSWSKWRIGRYEENLRQFENVVNALRTQTQLPRPHLNMQV